MRAFSSHCSSIAVIWSRAADLNHAIKTSRMNFKLVALAIGLSLTLFSAASNAHATEMFLELPGITGQSSTPGHVGITPIFGFAITPNRSEFSIFKLNDVSSPQIALAVVNGTTFATGSLLFYPGNWLAAGREPLVTRFVDIVGTSFQVSNSDNGIREQATFHFFTKRSSPGFTRQVFVPESGSTFSLLLVSVVALLSAKCLRFVRSS